MDKRSKENTDKNRKQNAHRAKAFKLCKERSKSAAKIEQMAEPAETDEQESESHHRLPDSFLVPFFDYSKQKSDAEKRHGKCFYFEVKTEQRDNPRRNCSTDIRAEYNADRLLQRYQTGIYKRNDHNSRCTR